jgi:hypothetical protein
MATGSARYVRYILVAFFVSLPFRVGLVWRFGACDTSSAAGLG